MDRQPTPKTRKSRHGPVFTPAESFWNNCTLAELLGKSGKVPLATAENWEAGESPALPPQR